MSDAAAFVTRGGVVFGAVRAAWFFLFQAWRRAWPAMGFAGVSMGLALSHVADLTWFWALLGALGILKASGSLWPLSIAMGGASGFLRARAVEGRLLAVAALSLIFLFVLFLLVFILVLCFAYAAAASGHGFVSSQIATWAPAVDDRGRVVVTLVSLAAFAGLGWAATRISLAAPATVEKGRVLVLATWPLTRGNGWRIALANGLNLVVPAALTAILMVARRWVTLPSEAVAFDVARGMVLAGLWLPLTIGLMGYFYRELSSVQTAPQIP